MVVVLVAVSAVLPAAGIVVAVTARAAGAAITNYTDPSINGPNGMTAGPDDALWFVNSTGDSIGRITTAGVISHFNDVTMNFPKDIAAGSDGALWFTNEFGNSIGRITTGGVVSNFTSPTISEPVDIVAGPDGALWFTNYSNNSIGRITTGGVVSNFTDPTISNPLGITVGSDGALWFADFGSSSIGRITTGGVVSNFTDPTIQGPNAIEAGPDGALWFANENGNSIGRITTGGVVSNFTDPNMAAPGDIAPGPDGALWFVNVGNNLIGRITTTGSVTYYTDPTIVNPAFITAGPDGAMWITIQGNNSIGRIDVPVNPPAAPTLNSVTAGNGSISVAFNGLAGAAARSGHAARLHPALAAPGYVASCNSLNAGIDGTASGTTSPLVVSGLTNGKSYQCSVFAYNAGGNSPPSALSAVVIPSAVSGTAVCTNLTICHASAPAAGSAAAPGQDANVTGTPDSPNGTIVLTQTVGTLGCPSVTNAPVPIYNLVDTGFSAATRLHVTLTLHFAAATATEAVCFNSTVPFASQEHPTVKTAGTGLLLDCAQVANIAPCVVSSKNVGSNIVVQFLVPGGDPRFYIVLPKGRAVWAETLKNATVGKQYEANMQSAGGKAPIHWSVTSGKLPAGLVINPTTGVIAGTPTAKGQTTALIQAKDSETRPKTAAVNLPFAVG
ncbi:MAG: putative Ig domain-containing protein [Acidimicrobiia bacterium]